MTARERLLFTALGFAAAAFAFNARNLLVAWLNFWTQ